MPSPNLAHRRPWRWIALAAASALLAALLPLGGVAMAASATQLVITSTVPTTADTGVAVAFTVEAQDGSGSVDVNFAGAVSATSTDSRAAITQTTLKPGVFDISVVFGTSGPQTVTFESPPLSGATSSAVDVSQSKLAITSTVPASTTAGTTISFTVEAQDSTGAPLTGFLGTVSVTSTDPHAVLAPAAQTYTSPSATFDVTLETALAQTVAFASPGLTPVSTAITVSPATASKLIFVQEPLSQTPTLLNPQPIVGIADAYGNLIRSASGTVTLALSNPNATSPVFSCTNGTGTNDLVLTTMNGLASYVGCTVSLTGSGYQLVATAPGYTRALSDPFYVTSGPASKLAFCWGPISSGCSTTAPTGSTGGTAFPAQPTIVLQDVNGNPVTSDSSTVVTLSIATPNTGATLACTSGTSLQVTAGVATFSGCEIDKVGTYQLMAISSPYNAPATSNAFIVSAGPAAKLAFTAQPTAGSAGQPFATQPVVAITDAGGNVATTSSATISLTLSGGTSGAVLSCNGGLSRATVSGVATFSGCSISVQGSNYVITALATNVTNSIVLPSVTTVAFNVTAPAAQISVTPSSSVIIWAKPVTLTTHFGINGANKSFALQASTDQLNWYQIAALTTNSAGNASFYYTPATNLWYRAVFAGTSDLSAANSTPIRVVVRQIALLRPTNVGRVVTIGSGTTLTWRVTVRPNRPNLPHAKVGWEFYIYRNGHWVYLTTRYAYTDNSGVATYSYTFRSAGQWYVRAKAFPLPLNANSYWSPINRYSVR